MNLVILSILSSDLCRKSKSFVMDVITIESQAYKDLITKINSIAKFIVENHPSETINPDEEWVDSYEICTFLNISERTLQRLRSNGMIGYSLLSGKTYYTIGEIKRMLSEKRIRSNEEALQNLIDNHRQYVQQRRIAKADK
jgi:AraC-like DNA-binding protein